MRTEATKKIFRIADEILLMLEKNLCTVQQATDILAYVSARIRSESYVQRNAEVIR